MRRYFGLCCIAAALLLTNTCTAQTTVTLNGQAYTFNAHPRVLFDGPTGSLTTAMSNSSATGRANINNPIYVLIKNKVDADKTNYTGITERSRFTMAALRWMADGDPQSLTMAKWGLNNIEKVISGTGLQFYCNESTTWCSGRAGLLDDTALHDIPLLYTILRSQLTPQERATFAEKVLNDNADGSNRSSCSSHCGNGLGGSATNTAIACTPQGSGVQWVSGNCGYIWLIKHHAAAPAIMPGQESYYAGDYPTMSRDPGSQTAYYNLPFTKLVDYILVGLALADDDPRAAALLQQAFTFYWNVKQPYQKSAWTGFNQGGPDYGTRRYSWMSTELALALRNSFAGGGPDLTTGVYLRRYIPYNIYSMLPNTWPNANIVSDDWGWGWAAQPIFNHGQSMAIASLMYAGEAMSAYGNWWVPNVMGFPYLEPNSNGQFMAAYFIGYDPAAPQSPVNTLPTQYVFRGTDYSECLTLFGSSCTNTIAFPAAVSKSDWTSTATHMLVQGIPSTGDHVNGGDWGVYDIYKTDYLLAGSGQTTNVNGTMKYSGNDHGSAVDSANGIQLGTVGVDNFSGGYSPILRWGGNDPQGDAQSRYFYLLMDLTGTYNSNMGATRVYRQFMHLKKPGTQDYVLVYDDVATSVGNMKNAMLHYWTGSGNSVTAGTLSVTAQNTGRRLNSQFLPVAGPNTIALDGTSLGSFINTSVHAVCASLNGSSCDASSTAGEWIAVHQPTTNTGLTMATIAQPACSASGGSCTVAEIQDASYPKVAVFARQGNLLSSVSFKTSHSGTAQYLVAGLAPGTYSVQRNGSTIQTGTVNSGDSTLYWESTSGTFSIGAGSGASSFTMTASPSTQTLGAGSTSATYNVSVTSVGSFTGTVNLSVSGPLPTGVTTSFSNSAPVLSAGATVPVVLTVNVNQGATTPTGTYNFTIGGTGGGQNVTATVALQINNGDFSVSATPTTVQPVLVGGSVPFTVTAAAVSGPTFSGTVSFTASASGMTGSNFSFSPASVALSGSTTSGSTTMTVNVPASTPYGTYVITPTGTSGSLVHNANPVSINVSDFAFSSSTASQNVAPGGTGTYGFSVSPLGNFTGNVSFSAAGAPANSTVTFSPTSVNTSGPVTMTVATPANASPATSSIVVTAKSGTAVHSATVALNVVDFSLSVSGSPQSVAQGSSATYTVNVSALNGFSGFVNLSAAGLPTGATASFSPATVASSGSTTLTIQTSSSTPAATSTITITGTSGSTSHTTTATLTVTSAPVANFSISSSSASQTVNAGATATYPITITGSSGFNGTVNLTATGLPAGANATFNPATVTGSGTTTMTVTTSASTPAATSTITVTGVSGSLQHATQVSLTVVAAAVPDFTIASTPTSQTVTQGNATTFTVSVSPVNGFTGTVTLSAAGLPAGATGSFSPPTIAGSGSSTLTIQTSASTPAASSAITVTGVSGSLQHANQVSLNVVAAAVPNFTISVSAPTSQTVTQGNATTFTVNVSPVNGFTGTVTLSAGGLPAGATGSFSPLTIAGSGLSTLTIQTSSSTPAATSTITVTGVSGSLQHATQATLNVVTAAVPDFTISVSAPTSQTVTPGNATTFTVNVSPVNGFSGTVMLSAAGLPSGTTGSFSPPTITGSGSSTLTIQTSSTASVGTSTISISGNSGALSHSTSASLTVVSSGTGAPPPPGPSFSLVASTSSQTIFPGGAATYPLSISGSSGFNGTVNLAASGAPSGATVTFSPASVTGTGMTTMTVNTTSGTPVSTSPITVTGTSGTQQQTVQVSLTVTQQPALNVSVSPPTVNLMAGQSAQLTVTLTSTVPTMAAPAFTCVGLPGTASCTFSKMTAQSTTVSTATMTIAVQALPGNPGGSGSATGSIVSLNTGPAGTQPRRPWLATVFGSLGFGVIGIVFAGDGKPRTKTATWLLVVLVVAATAVVLLTSGCGAASGNANSSGQMVQTTYSVNVTGSASVNGAQLTSNSSSIAVTITQ